MPKRREFLNSVGIGSLGFFSSSLPEGKIAKGKSNSLEKLQLGEDVTIDLLFSSDSFLGIGGVAIKNTLLRNPARPMFVEITNPDGMQLIDYSIADKKVATHEIRINFKAKVQHRNTMEWMLHTVRNRQNLSDWIEPPFEDPGTQIELIIYPVARKIGRYNLTGLSYQYKYKSNSIPIYRILDKSSWEINGNAIGNQFWMRNGVVDSIVDFNNINQFYSTEWYLPGIANPNIFQYHPLQTQLQGFTFTSSNAGTLITWPTKVSHIRSLFEKWRQKNDIIHYHEHCYDLAHEFETNPVEVLWCPESMDRVGRANFYGQVREMVHTELHQQIGMKRERISTYGIIEEWTEPDFTSYREEGLDALIEAGVKTVFIPNQCQNAMNTWGLSNMCCNIDFKISETVGEDNLKMFCEKARNSGMRVEMWGNTALSTLTELFSHRDGKEKGIKFIPYQGSIMEVIDRAESPWVRNPSNAIEADHYTPRFCALNLRDGEIRKYWMKQWKHFHDVLGIEGIFLDSSFNMSSDKFHFRQWPEGRGWHGATLDQKDALGMYRPEKEPPKMIQTQYHAHLEWVVEMQQMGYRYCAEDMGVFGVNRTGPDVVNRASNLFLWQDCYCDFDESALTKAGYNPFDVFFKGLAYRTMWKVYWDIPSKTLKLGIRDSRAYTLLKIFNLVEDKMYHQEILNDEAGVSYSKNGEQVLWVFKDLDFSLGKKKKFLNLVNGKSKDAANIKAKKYQVYLITDHQ